MNIVLIMVLIWLVHGEHILVFGSYMNLLVLRYTMERPRFSDHLEAIKFICKDFWSELFKKQIDNLKTNHKVTSTTQVEIGTKIHFEGLH